jgi:ribonucleoside-diphosphate reductase alpha subunit
MPTE